MSENKRKTHCYSYEQIIAKDKAIIQAAIDAENQALRAKNRELNRRCQALQHTINIGSERKAWYGYWVAASQLYGEAMRECERLRASLAEVRAAQRWIPVEEQEPPKDGREVLLRVSYRAGIPNGHVVGHWMRGGHCIEDHPPIDEGWYFWNGCYFDQASKPTHWKYLDAPVAGVPEHSAKPVESAKESK